MRSESGGEVALQRLPASASTSASRLRSVLAAAVIGAAVWQGVSAAPARGPHLQAPGTPALVDTVALVRHAERAVTPPGRLIGSVRPGSSVELRSAPGGESLASAGELTEFGSPTHFSVARTQGRWLGLVTPELPNGELAWVDRRGGGLELSRTRWSLHADLSDGRLELRRAGRVVHSAAIGSGAAGSPTPTGRFAVTDKLAGSRFSASAYGCCVLALSGHQENTPSGWRGGNRLALHAGGPSATASTAGCIRASEADMQVLMDRVPLGTPVFIAG